MSDILNKQTPVFRHPMIGVPRRWQRKLRNIEGSGSRTFPVICLRLILPIIALMSFFNIANAGNLSLLVNGKALHMNPPNDTEYNENNWGAGIQYDFESYGKKWVPFVTASGFIDSFENPSYYTGAGFVRRIHLDQKRDSHHFDAGIIGFLMTRKDFRDGDPFFGMLPAFSFGTRRYAVNMTYIPKVDPKMVALWFFQFKISTDNF